MHNEGVWHLSQEVEQPFYIKLYTLQQKLIFTLITWSNLSARTSSFRRTLNNCWWILKIISWNSFITLCRIAFTVRTSRLTFLYSLQLRYKLKRYLSKGEWDHYYTFHQGISHMLNQLSHSHHDSFGNYQCCHYKVNIPLGNLIVKFNPFKESLPEQVESPGRLYCPSLQQ